jgi:hypothetical protein
MSYKSPNPGAQTGKKRLPNPHAKNLKPSKIAAPRVQSEPIPVDNSVPVSRERITQGGAKLKAGQRAKAPFKVPPMHSANPWR